MVKKAVPISGIVQEKIYEKPKYIITANLF
jgi:hypothetical protein